LIIIQKIKIKFIQHYSLNTYSIFKESDTMEYENNLVMIGSFVFWIVIAGTVIAPLYYLSKRIKKRRSKLKGYYGKK
jgi:hypothetical protein